MNSNSLTKRKNSVKLSKEEIEDIRVRMGAYSTKVAAGIGMGINKDTLVRTLAFGSCNEESYKILFPGKEVPR